MKDEYLILVKCSYTCMHAENIKWFIGYANAPANASQYFPRQLFIKTAFLQESMLTHFSIHVIFQSSTFS